MSEPIHNVELTSRRAPEPQDRRRTVGHPLYVGDRVTLDASEPFEEDGVAAWGSLVVSVVATGTRYVGRIVEREIFVAGHLPEAVPGALLYFREEHIIAIEDSPAP